ncbi:MAG: hypothetical protein WC341_09355 [Bacteroidales bacterium]|jgi:predicted hotdog family 3-hydroxylacyl-ACP dehydratase
MKLDYLIVGKEQIERLIPQRHPMMMVDGLLLSDEKSTTSTLKVLSDNIFVGDGLLQEPGIIENMAQTVALRAGYEAQQHNKKPEVGFIGAVKRLKIERLPKVNEQLITTIDLISQLLGATIVHATTRVMGQQIAEADLSVFLSKPTKTPLD